MIVSKDGEPVESCRIIGELKEPFLDRLAPCCGSSSFESIFFVELEEISKNCEYFSKKEVKNGRDRVHKHLSSRVQTR
jgi:hypothetical protein